MSQLKKTFIHTSSFHHYICTTDKIHNTQWEGKLPILKFSQIIYKFNFTIFYNSCAGDMTITLQFASVCSFTSHVMHDPPNFGLLDTVMPRPVIVVYLHPGLHHIVAHPFNTSPCPTLDILGSSSHATTTQVTLHPLPFFTLGRPPGHVAHWVWSAIGLVCSLGRVYMPCNALGSGFLLGRVALLGRVSKSQSTRSPAAC